MSQRGIAEIMLIAGIGVAVAFAGMGAALKIQSSRLASAKTELADTKARFASFVADTKRLGLEAQKLSDARTAAAAKSKESSDAENTRTSLALATRTRELRLARSASGPSSNLVPAARSGASHPELACFNRAVFSGAVRDLDLGVQGLVDEGSKGAVDLNTAKVWAAGRGK